MTKMEITLDEGASVAEKESVKNALREEGFEPSFTSPLAQRSIEQAFPWLIIIGVALWPFWKSMMNRMGERAGDDVYNGIRRLIMKLAAARHNRYGENERRKEIARWLESLPDCIGDEERNEAIARAERLTPKHKGVIEIHDPSTRTHIILTDDLPDEAYEQLARMVPEQLQGGYWVWDDESREWDDPLASLKS